LVRRPALSFEFPQQPRSFLSSPEAALKFNVPRAMPWPTKVNLARAESAKKGRMAQLEVSAVFAR